MRATSSARDVTSRQRLGRTSAHSTEVTCLHGKEGCDSQGKRGIKGRKDEGWWGGGGAYLAALVLASRQRVDARQQPSPLLLRGLVADSPLPTARPQFVAQHDDDDDQRSQYADQDEQEDRQSHLGLVARLEFERETQLRRGRVIKDWRGTWKRWRRWRRWRRWARRKRRR